MVILGRLKKGKRCVSRNDRFYVFKEIYFFFFKYIIYVMRIKYILNEEFFVCCFNVFFIRRRLFLISVFFLGYFLCCRWIFFVKM